MSALDLSPSGEADRSLSRASHRAPERLRLAPVPWLLAFAFSLGAVLAAVVPTRQEYAMHADDPGAGTDAASLAYLQVLTRANPGDDQLRLVYVRRLAKVGMYDAALEALAPALPRQADADLHRLQLDLLLARARAIPEGDPRRAEAFAGVEAQLRTLLGFPWSADTVPPLVKLALELEQPRLAADFAHAAAQRSPRGAAMFAEAARWMRASGDAAGAVRDYRRAAELEEDPLRAREDAMLALATLEADERVGDAEDLAGAYLARWPGDAELLRRAADLASASGRAVAARDYGRRLVALEGSSSAALEHQVRLELASGDARAALPLIQELVAIRPDDVGLRRQEARVAEEVGQPQVALDAWVWLLAHDRGGPRGRTLSREPGTP